MKHKIKIMKTGPHVTEQEINKFMDFDDLLKRKEQVVLRHRRMNRVRNSFIGIIALMIMPAVLIITRQSEKNGPASADQIPSSSAVFPLDSAGSKASTPDAWTPAFNDTVDVAPRQSADGAQQNDRVREKKEKQGTPPPLIKEEQTSTPLGYVQPEPVDGYAALYTYFDRELRYPAVMAKDSVEGMVTVAFVIDVSGKVKSLTVENSLGDAFDQEVRRLIDRMPSWRPATYDGEPVESKVSLPITFSLKRNNNR